MRIYYIFFISFLLINCGMPSKLDVRKNLQEVSFDGVIIPEPEFNRDPLEIIENMKSKYEAKDAIIARPVWYTSKDDYDYWLKVEFLNPNSSNKDFNEFSKEVAIETIGHLNNTQDFKKIEISVVNEKGFIITFSSKQNIFFNLDSLQQKLSK